MSKKNQKQIKVNLIKGDHSAGRGVGFYTDNLVVSLSKLAQITLTDKNPDLIHYPFFDLFYHTLPLRKPKPTVITIHDLTPLVLKDKYPKGIRGSLNLAYQRTSLSFIKAVITDSHSSAKDINMIFKIPNNKIFIVYPAFDPVFNKKQDQKQLKLIKNKYSLPDKFILNVSGGPNPNKNLPSLARVTKNLNIPLVIVGGGMLEQISYPIHPELADLAKLKEFEHIIYPGFVSTHDLAGIYQLASLYCQPSLYEGFGIPLLEAQASGCLLVSSNSSSLPELYAKDTINFQPNKLPEFTKAISQALSLTKIQKKNFIVAGRLKAKQFNWNKTAQSTLKVYQSVISKKFSSD